MPSILDITFLLTLLIVHHAIAAVLPASQTAFTTTTEDAAPAVTSLASLRGLDNDPRARQRRQENPGYVCGVDFLNTNHSLTCNDNSLSCVGTVFADGNAYAYCSTPNVASQWFGTTAYTYGVYSSCPSNAVCCDSTAPQIIVNLFIVGGYTATNYGCDNSSTTLTWNPDVDVLVPASYSLSLEELNNTPSTSSLTTSSTTTSSKTTSASTSASPSPTSGEGGMPEGEKIGLGVGIGVGIFGLALIGGAVYMLAPWIFRKKR